VKMQNIIVIVIVLYGIIGDLFFRNFFHMLGIIITALFVVFLIAYFWMDHKGMFTPEKLNKKKYKEG
jgi:chromate transport protein ChrA